VPGRRPRHFLDIPGASPTLFCDSQSGHLTTHPVPRKVRVSMVSRLVRSRGDTILVSFADNSALLDEGNSRALAEELFRLAEDSSGQELFLDLHKVEYLTGATLRVLLSLRRRLLASGKTVRLINLPPQIAEIFHVTKLDGLFGIRHEQGTHSGVACCASVSGSALAPMRPRCDSLWGRLSLRRGRPRLRRAQPSADTSLFAHGRTTKLTRGGRW
jgi:anti-anti-sigma factor